MRFVITTQTEELVRGAAEVAGGGSLGAAPLWFHYLSEINVVLATISLSLGIVLGAHGVFRIARTYWKPRQ